MTNDGRVLGAQTRSARGLRRVPACADARAALPHARRGDRRLRYRACRGQKPRRADQQNAGEPHSRLRRAAALSRLGAADAAHRGGAEARSARRHPPQSRPGAEISLPRRRRGALRFRRLFTRRRDDDGAGPARRTQAPPRRSAPSGPHLRHRLCRGGRAGDVEHGLPLDADDGRRARKIRTEKRRGIDGDGEHRSARRGHRHRRRHSAGPEPRDGAGADRRRTAWIKGRRYRSGAGDGHRQGPVVDRGRHLFEPLRLGHRGRRAYGRDADARQAQRHRRETAQRADGRRRTGRRQDQEPLQSRQCAALRPRRRHFALVAAVAARKHGAGLERNRHLVAAGTGNAVARRPHQHLAHLRLHLRHVRHRDRSVDLCGSRRPLCVDARCRAHHESDRRRRPNPRRLRPRHRRGALRGVHL